MTHAEYVNILKGTLQKLLLNSVLTFLYAEVPLLSVPPLKNILSFFINKIISILLNQTELAIFLRYTDIRVSQEGKAFNDAVLKNHEAQTQGDENARKIAEKNLMDTFRIFAKLN